jgi:hypothetical protein
MIVVPTVVLGSLAVFAVFEAFAFGVLKNERSNEKRVQPE